MNIQSVPIWLFALATIIIVLLAIEVGYRLGQVINHYFEVEKESSVTVISGAILGLLSFMLAFNFGIAYDRFNARKELVRNDANSIRTTWLMSDFMQEPDREKSVKLFKKYVDLRVAALQSLNTDTVEKAMKETEGIHRQLWDIAVVNGKKDMNSDVASLYIASLNEMIDIHTLRIARGYQSKMPLGLWLALYSLLFLGMISIGYQTAIAESKRTAITIILAISFTIVFVLIAALDRPQSGFFKVTQQPMFNIQKSMSGDPVLVTDSISK